MKLRVALLAVLTFALAAVLLFQPIRSYLGGARPASVTPDATDAFDPFPGDTSVTLEGLRERALEPYRLKPDARFLLAVREVARLAGGPDSAVTADHHGRRWRIRWGSREVGSLAELPDFPEMLDLLTEWARAQAWQRGWADAGGPPRRDLQAALDRLDARGALIEADRAWAKGARDAQLFRYLTRAYTLLALASPDRVGTTDPIVARGFTTLALARALGAEEPTREACLLAEVMGYAASAREQARGLGREDPVRMFVTRDDQALEAAAASASTLEAPYLHLQRTARLGELEKWQRLMQTRFANAPAPPTVASATGLEMERFEAHVAGARAVVHGVARTLAERGFRAPAPSAGHSGRSLADMVTEFERIVEDSARATRGRLLDRTVMSAYLRSLYYSALDVMAGHYMETLSAAAATNWFTGSAKTRLQPGAAAEFHRWCSHLASARAGRGDAIALTSDLQSIEAFGAPLALRTYARLRENILPGDPKLRGAVQALVRRLDSRPEHRVELITIAERDLSALDLAERLGRSAAAAEGASKPYLLAWTARFLGDYDSLRAVLALPNTDPRQRRAVLQLASSVEELPDSVIRAAFEREVADSSAQWAVVDQYVDWLEAKKRYREARVVLERWRARSRSDSSSGIEQALARTRVARLLQLEGRAEAGLDTLGDLHRGLQFDAMQRTALLQQELGRTHQALALGWAAHRRHRDRIDGYVLVAELCWRQGRYAQAAGILRESKRPISSEEWSRAIAPRFVDCFRARPRDGVKAAEALLRAGFRDDATIGAIPAKLDAEGLHQLAFDIQSRVRGDGAQPLESVALAYGYLKRARGEREAIAWVRGQVPGPARKPFGRFAHRERHHELLWEAAPNPIPEGANGDYYWLMRAAACRTLASTDPRHAGTVRHLAAARGTYYLDIARCLVGLREEAAVLALARGSKRKAEIFYFLGFKAEHENRLHDAADWYLMSAETGAASHGEPRWAARQLERWAERGRSLDVIARARRVPA